MGELDKSFTASGRYNFRYEPVSKPHHVAGPDDYPDWVCLTCGEKFGRGMPEGHIATWHVDKCGICNQEVEVTEPRDFRHLKKWPIKDK